MRACRMFRKSRAVVARGSVRVLVALAVMSGAAGARAASGDAVLILDSSNSMWGQVDGQHKVLMARKALADTFSTFQDGARLGLIAYGHRRRAGCTDIQTLVPLSDIGQRHAAAVRRIKPTGNTPIARSLNAAARLLATSADERTIVLLADGVDNCGPDPCASSAALKRTAPGLRVDVIALAVPREKQARLSCMASNTGGTFFAAEDAAGLGEALSTVFQRITAAEVAEPVEAPVAASHPPRPRPNPRLAAVGAATVDGAFAIATPVLNDAPPGQQAADADALAPLHVPQQEPGERHTVALVTSTPPGQPARRRVVWPLSQRHPAPRDAAAKAPEPEVEKDAEVEIEAATDRATPAEPAGVSEPERTQPPGTSVAAVVRAATPALVAAPITPPVADPITAKPNPPEILPDVTPPPADDIVTGAIPGPPAPAEIVPHDLEADEPALGKIPDQVRPQFVVSSSAVEFGEEGIDLRAQITASTATITRPVEWSAYLVNGSDKTKWRTVAGQSSPQAALKLPPGQYAIRATYGAVRAAKVVVVQPGRRVDLTAILNAGGLRVLPGLAYLDAPQDKVAKHWVFTVAPENTEQRRLYAEWTRPGQVIRMNAGTYLLVSRFGIGNAVVETGITIKPGMLTEVEINHKVAIVTLRFIVPPGNAVDEQVVWRIEDNSGRIILRSDGLETSHILVPGDYRVIATHRKNRYESSFTVSIGETRAVEIDAR